MKLGDKFYVFHESMQDKQVASYLSMLAPYEQDDLLRMLLEVHSPLEAIDYRLKKLRLKRNEADPDIVDLGGYMFSAEEKLNHMALAWFNMKK